MNAQDMGTTGLQQWVVSSHDVGTFRERRDTAEDIIHGRCGSFAAMLFVERLCNPKMHLSIARQKARDEELFKRHVQSARRISMEIKQALVHGKPNPFKALTWEYESIVELAFDMASTGLVLPSEKLWWEAEAEAVTL